ncbi:MAG: hypothetical protein D6725_08875 [Planctomycetota bacterium]|nr:MAG: hypothetical protein D6725_08875 [Planctomycetota bacterium]
MDLSGHSLAWRASVAAWPTFRNDGGTFPQRFGATTAPPWSIERRHAPFGNRAVRRSRPRLSRRSTYPW